MSTVTYTFPAIRVAFDNDTELPLAFRESTVSASYEAGTTELRYTIDALTEALPTVVLAPTSLARAVDGQDVEDLIGQGFAFGDSAGRVRWTDGDTFLFALSQVPETPGAGTASFRYFVRIGGVPLPEFASVGEVAQFLEETEGSVGPAPAGRAFGPGQPIVLSDIPGAVAVTETASGPTEGPDVLDGDGGPNEIDGLGGDDVIRGGAGDDTLRGGAGDDSIEGQDGNDSLVDGSGDDSVLGGAGADTIDNAGGSDRFDGGDGRDLLISDVTGLASNGAVLLVDLQNGIHGQRDSLAGRDVLTSIEDFTALGDWAVQGFGTEGANALTSDRGNDVLGGNGGDDTLSSGAGDDTLNGGAGADDLIGGAGSDVYIVDAGDRVTERAGDAGRDEMRADFDARIAPNVEQITGIGSGDIRLDGSAGDETLVGNGGRNILVGRGGADTMTGGAGADSFVLTGRFGTGPDVTVTDWGIGADRLAVDDQLLGIGARGVAVRDLTVAVFRDIRESGVAGYNGRTGEVLIDLDGDGAREVVADLGAGTRLGLDDVLLF